MGKKPYFVWTVLLMLFVSPTATAQVTSDIIAPIITINGDSRVTLEAGDSYTDAGVTTTDNQDAAISVTTLSSVNRSKAGTYIVTYIAEDSSGNRSKAIRIIVVTDKTPPQISLNGEQIIRLDVGSTYADKGVISADNSHGAISIHSISNINLTKAGIYSVIYTAIDPSGNQSSVNRQIIIKQTDTIAIAPVVTLNGNDTITIEAGQTYTDTGAIAVDNIDGDIDILMNLPNVNTTTSGSYVIDDETTDTADYTDKMSQEIIVKPALIARQPSDLVAQWNFDETDGIVANDTSGLNNHLSLNHSSLGSRVPGKLGSALAVEAYAQQDASIHAGSHVLQPKSVTLSAWINPDQSQIEWEWVAAQGDNYGLFIEPESKKLVFYKKEWNEWTSVKSPKNSIKFNQWQHILGTFEAATGSTKLYINGVEVGSNILSPEIVYSEGEGFTIGSMQNDRYFSGKIDDVRVYSSALTPFSVNQLILSSDIDTDAPVISFNGSKTVDALLESSYHDDGVTALDNRDGQVAVSSDAASVVDTSQLGSYLVTYTATDAAGNAAKATRIIEVITADHIAPVITLKGANPVVISKGSRYKDKGAITSDNVDHHVHVNIDTSAVDTSMTGTYQVIFSATDEAYNQQTLTRTVIISDNPMMDQSIVRETDEGSDQSEEGRRLSIELYYYIDPSDPETRTDGLTDNEGGIISVSDDTSSLSLEFNHYIDPSDPGAIADWLTDSKGDIISVSDDTSFTSALKLAQPGDRIQLESGIYKMQKISISGQQGRPITIESKPGDWAIFDGSVSGSSSQISIADVSWVNFRNFEVKNGRVSSLYITHTHHSLFEGLKIHNNARGFDFTDGSHHSLIRYCESYHNFDPSNHGQDGDGFGIWSEGPYNDAIGEGVILEHNIA